MFLKDASHSGSGGMKLRKDQAPSTAGLQDPHWPEPTGTSRASEGLGVMGRGTRGSNRSDFEGCSDARQIPQFPNKGTKK